MEAVNNLENDFKYIVYCTTNLVNNKIYIGVHKTYTDKFDNYIGCGVYINKPWTYEQSKTMFQRAVKKYGVKNFNRKTLAIFDSEEDAMHLEEELVNEDFLARDDVYNMILGGYGNKNMKEYQICCCYDLTGNFVKKFNSIREAGRYMTKNGCVFSSIKNAIVDKVQYRNMYWSFDECDKLNLDEYALDRVKSRIKVYQYACTGEYECEYTSITEAAKAHNMAQTSIHKACTLGYLSKNKYFSFEKNDQFSNAKNEYLKTVPIHVYDYSGNFITTFSNEDSAKKYLKIKGSLLKYLKLKEPYKKLYQFSFEKIEKMPDKTIGEKKQQRRKIDQFDLEGNFIKTWNSISECCRNLGISTNQILRILKGEQYKIRQGFTFKEHLNN